MHCDATPTAVRWTLYRYFSYNALCCNAYSCQMDTLQVLQLQCIVLLRPKLSVGHSTGTSVTMHCAATPTAVRWTLYTYCSYNALYCYAYSCQMDTLQVLQLQCIVLLRPRLSVGHSTGTAITMHCVATPTAVRWTLYRYCSYHLVRGRNYLPPNSHRVFW